MGLSMRSVWTEQESKLMQYEVSGSDKSKGQKLERSVGLELSVKFWGT